MSFRWATVFLDFPAGTFDAGVAFWQAVTGYGLSPARGPGGDFATLLPPSGDAYLRVQRLLGGAGGCHLDLHVDVESEPLTAVAARATGLGARTRHVEDGLIVAESPGGFPFCLVDWAGERTVPPPLDSDGGPAGQTEPAGQDKQVGGVSRLDTLCLDVPAELYDRELTFWEQLTRWTARPARIPGFTTLSGSETPIRLLMQRLETAVPGQPVRAHADFGADDPGAVARHVRLGAHVTATFPQWTVLTDPAGRRYCLINRRPLG